LAGGGAVLEEVDNVIYLALSLRNVGSGIAVLHGWRVEPAILVIRHDAAPEDMQSSLGNRPEPSEFRPQTRDIYVPPGDDGFWQAAIRQADDPDRPRVAAALVSDQPLVIVDLLYGDQEGGQRTISRFTIGRHPAQEQDWIGSVVRHWYLDRHDPRP
jgi:hypothetical protein